MSPSENLEDLARVFAYGTLLVPEVMETVIGRRSPGRGATLPGYARFLMQGELFPAIVPQAGSETLGLVFEDIRPNELQRLDDYEGAMYRRVTVRVVLDAGDTVWGAVSGAAVSGATLSVVVYALRPEHRDCLSNLPWDPEHFAAQELARFMRREFG